MGALRQRSALVFAIVWVGLFGVTFGIKSLAESSPSRTVSADSDVWIGVLKDLTKMRLQSMPRSSGSSNLVQVDSKLYPSLNEELKDTIVAHKKTIKGCISEKLEHSELETHYLEFSFTVTTSGANSLLDKQPTLALNNIILERSTISLSSTEQVCLIDAFNQLSFRSSDKLPQDRVGYQLCVNREHSAK